MALILIVDDEKSIRITLREFLQGEKHDVLVAKDAESALNILKEESIDVMVSDIILPKASGMELLRQAHEISPDTQVVIMTGEPSVETASETVREGAFDYLAKPIEKHVIIRTVNQAAHLRQLTLERSRLRRENIQYQQNLEQLVEERTHALRDSEARLRAILENAVDPIITIDSKGIIDSFNQAAELLFGYSMAELLGKSVNALMPESYTSSHDAYIADYLRTGEKKVIGIGREVLARTKQGEEIPIELTVGEVNLGGMLFFTATIRDLRERKAAEKREEERQTQLILADKMVSLGVLVSGVAHEINNPNHLIMLGVNQFSAVWESVLPVLEGYYAENGDFDVGGLPYSEVRDEVAGTLDAIRGGAVRIKTIVSELRDYARVQPTPRQEPVDINQVVASANTLLTHMLKKSTDCLELDLEENMPLVLGDHQQLEQVLINIIRNACQAHDDATGTIAISTRYDTNTGNIILQVSDEGRGIPQELIARTIDPFFTTKRDLGATGLGLSISSSIVMEHGGTLDISSVVGKGTIVKVMLPERLDT